MSLSVMIKVLKRKCLRLDLKLKWQLKQEERIAGMFCHFLPQPTMQSSISLGTWRVECPAKHLFLSDLIFAISPFVYIFFWFFLDL